MPFIEDFLHTYRDAESPDSFFYWSAIACISSVVRKNIFINKKIYRLYPNLYIMFVAKSGLRKGYPIKQAQKIVELTEVIKVISGRNSIQSVLTELSKAWTTESGKVLKDAQALITNDELDTLLIGDPQAQTILTTLYDSFYHKNWTSTLKSTGRENLKDINICLLSGTNPTHLNNFLDGTSMTGGFLGRTLIVFESRKSKLNPLIEESDAAEIDVKPLVEELIRISTIVGQMSFTKQMIINYKSWYKDFYTRLQDDEIDDNTGTAERAGDTVLKLSMLLSINDANDLVIHTKHLDKAIDLFYESSKSSKIVTVGRGKSELTDQITIVLGYLLGKPDGSSYKKQLLAAKYGDITASDLTEVIDTLEQAGLVEVLIDKENGPLYKLNTKYVSKFRAKMKEN